MENTLSRAMHTRDAQTENGMAAHSTSSDSLVDLFYKLGAIRGKMKDEAYIMNDFLPLVQRAWVEHPTFALRLLFDARNIRGGAGERAVFRTAIKFIADKYPESVEKNIHFIPLFGRWDDLSILMGTKVENHAIELWTSILKKGQIANNLLNNLDDLTDDEVDILYSTYL